MPSLWKKLFIIAAVLLVISLALSGGLWYQLYVTESKLGANQAGLETTKTGFGVTGKQLYKPEDEHNPGSSGYTSLRRQINLRLGRGTDCQNFVTPNDPAVAAIVREIAGDCSPDVKEYWRDFERLYNWVTENIDYSADSHTPLLPETTDGSLTWEQDFWRMPAETIEDKTGDCEDMALLLASMMLNYTRGDFAIWCVGVYASSPEYNGHIAVVVPVVGNELSILDPAEDYYTGCYSGWGLTHYDDTTAINDWLVNLGEKMPGAQIYVLFYDSYYREFSGTEEFIDFVRQR